MPLPEAVVKRPVVAVWIPLMMPGKWPLDWDFRTLFWISGSISGNPSLTILWTSTWPDERRIHVLCAIPISNGMPCCAGPINWVAKKLQRVTTLAWAVRRRGDALCYAVTMPTKTSPMFCGGSLNPPWIGPCSPWGPIPKMKSGRWPRIAVTAAWSPSPRATKFVLFRTTIIVDSLSAACPVSRNRSAVVNL